MSARSLAVGVGLLVACGCGPAKKPDPVGTAKFRFQVSNNAKMDSHLTSPLLGTIYGNVFLQEDVSVTGPRTGAMGLADVAVANVDLRSVDLSNESYTTPDLAPGNYVFLGFYDVNGNGDATRDPDPGDPVTLATTNNFAITDGNQTPKIVIFDLIYF